jgi:hypothetical protein
LIERGKEYIIPKEVRMMPDTVVVPLDEKLIDIAQEEKIGTRKKYDSWDYALGMNKVEGWTPSHDFLNLVERERRGEITTMDIKKYLDQKYKVKGRD